MNTLTKILIGAGVVVGGYQLYKYASKPKNPPKSGETKSSATGTKRPQAGTLKYDKGTKKVSKLYVDGFDTRWVRLAEQNQPKAFEHYNYNGRWVWTKWNGALDI